MGFPAMSGVNSSRTCRLYPHLADGDVEHILFTLHAIPAIKGNEANEHISGNGKVFFLNNPEHGLKNLHGEGRAGLKGIGMFDIQIILQAPGLRQIQYRRFKRKGEPFRILLKDGQSMLNQRLVSVHDASVHAVYIGDSLPPGLQRADCPFIRDVFLVIGVCEEVDRRVPDDIPRSVRLRAKGMGHEPQLRRDVRAVQNPAAMHLLLFTKQADDLAVIGMPQQGDHILRAEAKGAVVLDHLNELGLVEVLDRSGEVIDGLYAGGNDSGGFFSNCYPELVVGIAMGRTFTFARLAGENMAAAVAADPGVSELRKQKKEIVGGDGNGTYTVTRQGMGDVTVTCTFKDSKLIDVQIVGDGETKGYGLDAIPVLRETLLSAETPEIDAVSGSTITSNAVISAVKECFQMAGVAF